MKTLIKQSSFNIIVPESEKTIGKEMIKATAIDQMYWAQMAIAPNIKEYDEAIMHLDKAIELITQLKRFEQKQFKPYRKNENS